MSPAHHPNASRRRAFSLVEMLVVIAVIGIMSAIVIPIIANVTTESKRATALRNAQSVATVANQALHAGDTTISGAATKALAVELLAGGVTGEGSFAQTLFRLPLSEAEQTRALPYLDFEDGLLTVDYAAR